MTREVSRRSFLISGSSILITASLDGFLENLFAASDKKFSGDNPDQAHRLLRTDIDPIELRNATLNPHVFDVVIVGGGLAGLTAAYLLREHDILLLERHDQAGGVARSGSWRGVEYCMGSAYIAKPEPDSQIGSLFHDIGIADSAGRVVQDDNRLVINRQKLLRSVLAPENAAFFSSVLQNHYPEVPPTDHDLLGLDNLSFEQLLHDPTNQKQFFGTALGTLSRAELESIEYYCWGAFGASASEISAYHGLNFVAAEFGDILVFPGGNAYVAKRLASEIRRKKPSALQTGTYALRIAEDGKPSRFVITANRNERLVQFRARSVILSCPLFVSKRIAPFLLPEQIKAIDALRYRSYVVANFLLTAPLASVLKGRMFRDIYSLSRTQDIDISRVSTAELWKRSLFSDAEVAGWAARSRQQGLVLTLYCPLPYEGGSAYLLTATVRDFEDPLRKLILELLAPFGLRPRHIAGARLTRWGHALILAKPGQLVNNTLTHAVRSLPGLFFAHTDTFGAPAFENAVGAAFRAVENVRSFLKS